MKTEIQWYSVEDKLPEDGENVLTNLKRELLFKNGYFLGDLDKHGYHSFFGITHWGRIAYPDFNKGDRKL